MIQANLADIINNIDRKYLCPFATIIRKQNRCQLTNKWAELFQGVT